MMDSNIQEKVHKVEEFFDGHLKPQLVRAIAERDKVFEQQKMLFVKEHRELREEQRTMVNLGSILYMQADVYPPHICGCWTWIPCGVYLASQIEECTCLFATIKARIKLVCEGIRELLQLPADKSLPERVFLIFKRSNHKSVLLRLSLL